MNRWITLFFAAVSTMCFAAVSDFTVEVCVGDSTEPTMVFGVASEADIFPMPPYSGMFGVKDFYIDGDNANGSAVTGDNKRLSSDVRVSGAESYDWVICSTNASATLTFKKTGDQPLYYGYTDKKGVEQKGKLGETLSVKAGINYVISTQAISDVAGQTSTTSDPKQPYIGINKDETSGEYTTEKTIEVGAAGDYLLAFAPDTDCVVVKYTNADGTYIYELNADGTKKEITPEALAEYKGWICEVEGVSDGNVSFGAPDTAFGKGALSLLFTTSVDNAQIKLNITTTSGSAKQMGCYVSPVDGEAIIAAALMRYTKGTLDFDQDGDVDLDDATFLYNYALNDCGDWQEVSDIMPYTTDYATEEGAQKALDYFKDNFDELFFDGSEAIVDNILDCATFFYNYALNDFGDWQEVSDIMPYTTEAATTEKASTALETMKELKEE